MPKLLENVEAFDGALVRFARVSQSSMKLARQLAEYSFYKFAMDGDLSFATRFWATLPENYHRKIAFKIWMTTLSPCKLEKASKTQTARFVKDKSEGMPAFAPGSDEAKTALVIARSKAYWEFAPEKTSEVEIFSYADILNALRALIKKFSNKDKFKSLDNTANGVLQHLDRVISDLEKPSFAKTEQSTTQSMAA